MQLIPEGPNIPEALLNAHADGTVVFFFAELVFPWMLGTRSFVAW